MKTHRNEAELRFSYWEKHCFSFLLLQKQYLLCYFVLQQHTRPHTSFHPQYLTQRARCISCSDSGASPLHLCRTVVLSPGGCQTAAALGLYLPSEILPSHPQKKKTWMSPETGTRSASVSSAAPRGKNPETLKSTNTFNLSIWFLSL